MRKKLLFLAVTIAICGMPLITSCSKDEPTPADVAKKDVSGTKWIGLDNYYAPMTLRFKNDGTFVLDVDNSAGAYARGTYTQDGTAIKFNVTSKWAFWNDFYEGTISYGGASMDVPIYYYDGSSAGTLNFTLTSLK
ncbi:MAG: hypothetical protein HDS67_01965 [Bacteroidales bacterium]|nr:hypothetical protein [Bacteroidales bacterium]